MEKAEAPGIVVALHRLEQAHVAFLNQIGQGQTALHVLARHRNHQTQIGLHQRIFCLFGRGAAGLHLLLQALEDRPAHAQSAGQLIADPPVQRLRVGRGLARPARRLEQFPLLGRNPDFGELLPDFPDRIGHGEQPLGAKTVWGKQGRDVLAAPQNFPGEPPALITLQGHLTQLGKKTAATPGQVSRIGNALQQLGLCLRGFLAFLLGQTFQNGCDPYRTPFQVSRQIIKRAHAQCQAEHGVLNTALPVLHYAGQTQFFLVAQKLQIPHIPQVEVHGIVVAAQAAPVPLTPVPAQTPVVRGTAAFSPIPTGSCPTTVLSFRMLCFQIHRLSLFSAKWPYPPPLHRGLYKQIQKIT